MVMPFGRHKGEDLADIDPSYLTWVLSNIDVKEPLKQEIIDTLEEQGIIVTPDMMFDSGTQQKGKFDNSSFKTAVSYLNPNSDMKKILRELIDLGYKGVAKRVHPDKGGSKEDMQALNDVKDWLMKGLGL